MRESSLLSEAVKFFQCLAWHLEAVSFRTAHFDDVPFGAGTGFAEVKYFFIKVALESFFLVFLDVNRPGASGEFPEHGNRITVPTQAVADIHLHIHFGVRLAEKNLPGKMAVDLFEIKRVRMVADAHFVRPACDGRSIQESGQLGDPFFGAHFFLGRRHIEVLTAERLIVFDGSLEIIQRLQIQVHAAAFEAAVVEHLPQIGPGVSLINVRGAAITPKLDRLVADLAQLLERFRHIAGEFAADAVKLKSNWNRLRLASSHGQCTVEGHTDGSAKARFDKPATCNLHKESGFEVVTCIRQMAFERSTESLRDFGPPRWYYGHSMSAVRKVKINQSASFSSCAA